jgi:hypothetical protein
MWSGPYCWGHGDQGAHSSAGGPRKDDSGWKCGGPVEAFQGHSQPLGLTYLVLAPGSHREIYLQGRTGLFEALLPGQALRCGDLGFPTWGPESSEPGICDWAGGGAALSLEKQSQAMRQTESCLGPGWLAWMPLLRECEAPACRGREPSPGTLQHQA